MQVSICTCICTFTLLFRILIMIPYSLLFGHNIYSVSKKERSTFGVDLKKTRTIGAFLRAGESMWPLDRRYSVDHASDPKCVPQSRTRSPLRLSISLSWPNTRSNIRFGVVCSRCSAPWGRGRTCQQLIEPSISLSGPSSRWEGGWSRWGEWGLRQCGRNSVLLAAIVSTLSSERVSLETIKFGSFYDALICTV